MKAVILARVSSREQEEGKSIDAQLENLNNYCKKNDFEIVKTFQITESSTKGDRKKFLEMLAFTKPSEVNLLLLQIVLIESKEALRSQLN
jgi:DNA invertase Pin-like site-specific DNA recombinase